MIKSIIRQFLVYTYSNHIILLVITFYVHIIAVIVLLYKVHYCKHFDLASVKVYAEKHHTRRVQSNRRISLMGRRGDISTMTLRLRFCQFYRLNGTIYIRWYIRAGVYLRLYVGISSLYLLSLSPLKTPSSLRVYSHFNAPAATFGLLK